MHSAREVLDHIAQARVQQSADAAPGGDASSETISVAQRISTMVRKNGPEHSSVWQAIEDVSKYIPVEEAFKKGGLVDVQFLAELYEVPSAQYFDEHGHAPNENRKLVLWSVWIEAYTFE